MRGDAKTNTETYSTGARRSHWRYRNRSPGSRCHEHVRPKKQFLLLVFNDGAGVHKVLLSGASAAMLGKRFVATRESNAHTACKQALVPLMVFPTTRSRSRPECHDQRFLRYVRHSLATGSPRLSDDRSATGKLRF